MATTFFYYKFEINALWNLIFSSQGLLIIFGAFFLITNQKWIFWGEGHRFYDYNKIVGRLIILLFAILVFVQFWNEYQSNKFKNAQYKLENDRFEHNVKEFKLLNRAYDSISDAYHKMVNQHVILNNHFSKLNDQYISAQVSARNQLYELNESFNLLSKRNISDFIYEKLPPKIDFNTGEILIEKALSWWLIDDNTLALNTFFHFDSSDFANFPHDITRNYAEGNFYYDLYVYDHYISHYYIHVILNIQNDMNDRPEFDFKFLSSKNLNLWYKYCMWYDSNHYTGVSSNQSDLHYFLIVTDKTYPTFKSESLDFALSDLFFSGYNRKLPQAPYRLVVIPLDELNNIKNLFN